MLVAPALLDGALRVTVVVVVGAGLGAEAGCRVGGAARARRARRAAGGQDQRAGSDGRDNGAAPGPRGRVHGAGWRGRVDHGHSVADRRALACDRPVTMRSMSAEAPPTPAPHTHAPGAQPHRGRRHVDWELVVCGFRGHVLVGRDAEATRAQDAALIAMRAICAGTGACAATPGCRWSGPSRRHGRTRPSARTSSCPCADGPYATRSCCGDRGRPRLPLRRPRPARGGHPVRVRSHEPGVDLLRVQTAIQGALPAARSRPRGKSGICTSSTSCSA